MRRIIISMLVAATLLSACGTSNSASAPAPAPTAINAAAPTSASAPAAGAIQISDVWARPAITMGGDSGGAMGDAKPTGAAMGDAKPTDAAMAGGEGGSNGAMYLTISNSGDTPDRLVKASGDIAKSIELHTVIKNGDVMQMRPVEAIDVPAKGSVKLMPGSFHVMLIGLNRELKLGDTFDITLQFEKAGPIKVQATVKQPE